jgi:integrase
LVWGLLHGGRAARRRPALIPIRSEAARLLRAAWRARQVMRDKVTLRAVGRHVARFILVGLYTGTRSAAICGAALMPTVGRDHVDLEKGVFYRRAIGRRQTKKRQPPVKLPPRLLAHMRRWAAKGLARKAVVEWNGKPVESVRKGFVAAVQAAGLGTDVTPHILRHTCATRLMQGGTNLWDDAIAALGGHHAARNPVNESGRKAANVTKIIDLAKGK